MWLFAMFVDFFITDTPPTAIHTFPYTTLFRSYVTYYAFAVFGLNYFATLGFAILARPRSEEHTSELQSRLHLVCRLLLEKKQAPLSTILSFRQISSCSLSCGGCAPN